MENARRPGLMQFFIRPATFGTDNGGRRIDFQLCI